MMNKQTATANANVHNNTAAKLEAADKGALDVSGPQLNRRGFLAAAFSAAATAGISPVVARADELAPTNNPVLSRSDTFAWFPKTLFDDKGYARPLSKSKREFQLANGDALQAIILAVDDLKQANGGSLPAGYKVKIVTEVTGREHKEAIIPLDLVPKGVTPDSVRRFGLDKGGDRALAILSEGYLAVSLNFDEKGQLKLEHCKKGLDARDKPYQNHFYLELVPPKGK